MDENFEVVFYHGGRFVNDGSMKYIGESSILSYDPDRWSYFEIMSILREMGYVNVKELWYSVGGGHDYAHELLRSNPGSTVKFHVDENEGNPIFKRLYVGLKACKGSFFCCRPTIGVDGCFLKGKYGGKLLTAVGRDGNDPMLPLAYVVVELENKETWTWFLDLMIEDLGGPEICSKITFMSDQQKVSNYIPLLF